MIVFHSIIQLHEPNHYYSSINQIYQIYHIHIHIQWNLIFIFIFIFNEISYLYYMKFHIHIHIHIQWNFTFIFIFNEISYSYSYSMKYHIHIYIQWNIIFNEISYSPTRSRPITSFKRMHSVSIGGVIIGSISSPRSTDWW